MYNFVFVYDEIWFWVSVEMLNVLYRFVCFYGLCGMDDTMGEFLEDGYIDGE